MRLPFENKFYLACALPVAITSEQLLFENTNLQSIEMLLTCQEEMTFFIKEHYQFAMDSAFVVMSALYTLYIDIAISCMYVCDD